MGYFANGTEGMMFEERFCSRCVHSDEGPGKEIGVDPPCPIWMAHLLYSYELCNETEHPAKVMLDMLIKPSGPDGLDNECVMFVEAER